MRAALIVAVATLALAACDSGPIDNEALKQMTAACLEGGGRPAVEQGKHSFVCYGTEKK